jgi:3-hydroxy-9,10-secoandrosta-1,3,5(10)-triene-9,17-dione monooxygenase
MAPDGGNTSDIVTVEELVSRAQKVAPGLADRRAKAYDTRRVPEENIADIVSAGLLKGCQPKRGGGYELPFGAQTSAGVEIGKYCGSTAWIVSVCGTHHWMLGKFAPEAQDDVWGKNPDVISASAFASMYQECEKVEGGFKVSGRWMFSSGIHACDWCIIVGRIPKEDGPPDAWFMLVPKEDFEIQDNWRTVGLRGTGSNDFIIKDAFIPEHRTIGQLEINGLDTPGTAGNPDSVYRMPTMGVINYCVSAPTLGLAQGALQSYCDDMAPRTDIFAQKIASNATLQLRTSESSAEIDCAQLLYESDMARIKESVTGGAPLELSDIARIKRNASYVGQLAKRATNRLSEAMGARGLDESNFVHLAKSDIGAACSHISMVWDTCGLPHGMDKLGVLTEQLIGP